MPLLILQPFGFPGINGSSVGSLNEDPFRLSVQEAEAVQITPVHNLCAHAGLAAIIPTQGIRPVMSLLNLPADGGLEVCQVIRGGRQDGWPG